MKIMVLIGLFFISLSLVSQAGGESLDQEFLSLAGDYVEAEELYLIAEEGVRGVRFEDGEEQEHYFIQSKDYAQVMGYDGITNLAIIINSEGKVVSVSIIDTEDTPAYMRRIARSGFLNKFAGHPDIDRPTIVTGATVSCEAIIDTVNESVELFTNWLFTDRGGESGE